MQIIYYKAQILHVMMFSSHSENDGHQLMFCGAEDTFAQVYAAYIEKPPT